jgi:hypothetical protein
MESRFEECLKRLSASSLTPMEIKQTCEQVETELRKEGLAVCPKEEPEEKNCCEEGKIRNKIKNFYDFFK